MPVNIHGFKNIRIFSINFHIVGRIIFRKIDQRVFVFLIPIGYLFQRFRISKELESLSDAVLRLPDREKDILYFKYILEKTDAEIAEDLSIRPDSVREYLTRARRAAKRLMEQEENQNGKSEH